MGRAHPGADHAAAGPALSVSSQPVRPGSHTLADDVAQRCRAGMGAAAEALYGGDATATAQALRARAQRGAGRWPWLPGLCYGALEPLGVAFDRDDRIMAVAGKALVGLPVRPERVAEASRRLSQLAPPDPPEALDPALAAAVDRFWARLVGLARRLGEAVRAGDDAAVDELLQRARPKLRDSAAAVHEAVERVVAGSPAPEPSAPERPAPARPDPVPVEPEPEVEEDEAALGADRPYAPMIFVGGALLVALVWLLAVGLGTL